jgi:SAM-dependent methyltransferase
MDTSERPGFPRDELSPRYDVARIEEDEWHTYSDTITRTVLRECLRRLIFDDDDWVLNAGSGANGLKLARCHEISLDLFTAPIVARKYPVCGDVTRLPFGNGRFKAIVCVGEVLAYCDPSKAISEFARVIKPCGRLIFDFGSTRSWRHFGRASFGQAASLLHSEYNGVEERTWNYDPLYIHHLLGRFGFEVHSTYGAHVWSTLARRLGVGVRAALAIERRVAPRFSARSFSDTITVVADRSKA